MQLDLKDKKIISELDLNARMSFAEIGKKVRLSKQVVKYRIQKLESEKIIQGYNALVDISQLGQAFHLLYLKLIRISSQKEKEWIDKIDKDVNVVAVGKNAGHWDLTIVIRCSNSKELDEIIKKIILGKEANIKEKLITNEIKTSYFNPKLLFKGKDCEATTSDIQRNINLEEKDKKIISYLSDNCRISLLDLSEKIKLSPNGVKNKIKKLEEKKIIIGYKTKINYEKLGYLHFRVFLHLSKFTDELSEKIKSFLKSKENVESVSRYMGYADLEFRCYTKDMVGLYDLISEIKDTFLQNIIEIDSMPIFRWESIRYAPAPTKNN
jgi:Lrp/AsnC family transcriptional regulator, leucine-responsive regulatory protein